MQTPTTALLIMVLAMLDLRAPKVVLNVRWTVAVDMVSRCYDEFLRCASMTQWGASAHSSHRRITIDNQRDVWPLHRGNRNLIGPWKMDTDFRVKCTTCIFHSLNNMELSL